MSRIDEIIAKSPDPRAAALRWEDMQGDADLRRRLSSLEPKHLRDVIVIISISEFLYHWLCRHPDLLDQTGRREAAGPIGNLGSFDALRDFKYRELYRLTWIDLCAAVDYGEVLAGLSSLADGVLARALQLAQEVDAPPVREDPLCVMALGKLGAGELNYSSDVDMVFVSANHASAGVDIEEFQEALMATLRRFTRELEQRTSEGFLYRVDLNLRPWGRSGPLFMAIDDMEHYYEASSDAWERFAWLRARPVAGSKVLGGELLERMRPFVFSRSLSSSDLDRFFEIKHEMSKARRRRGRWNVKLGEGGIRDIEFFVQMLQIVNGGGHPPLRTPGTLQALDALSLLGLIQAGECRELRDSYLFLRRLENRLQMVDEGQIHELPEDPDRRLVLARSLDMAGESDDEVLHRFEAELLLHRSIARGYFERILPGSRDHEH